MLVRHGSYGRAEPPGLRVARFLCLTTGRTVSLLPDFLAARLPSSLAEVEHVVRQVEEHGVAQAAARVRPDVYPESGKRWVLRRYLPIVAALLVLQGLAPERLAGCRPKELGSYQAVAGGAAVLRALRGMAEVHLGGVIKPLGFRQGKVVHHPP